MPAPGDLDTARLPVGVAVALVALSPLRALAGSEISLEMSLSEGLVAPLPAFSAGALQDPAPEQEAAAPPDAAEGPETPPAEPWRVEVLPAFWIPLAFKGSISVGPIRTEIDLDIGDIVDNLDFAIEGGLGVTNEDWSFLLYATYLKLGSDTTSQGPLGTVESTAIEFRLALIDFAVGKRVGRWPIGSTRLNLDLLGGVRYWRQEVEISQVDPIGFDPMIDRKDDWVDAFVGGRFILDITDDVALWFRGDVGGFSIGSSADLTWTLTTMLEWKLSRTWTVVFGYRYLEVDWDTGSGLSRLEYDYKIHGPIIGVSIRF